MQLTSAFFCGQYLRHPINNLKTGIASRGNEQQSDAVDDIKCLTNEDADESENAMRKTENFEKGLKKSQTSTIRDPLF